MGLIAAGLAKYYVAFSRFTPWADEGAPDETAYNDDEIFRVHKELILGKRLQYTDTAYMITKRFWSSNTVFMQFDHRVDLRDTDFYVLNSANNVYKCLFNNYGVNSTVEPTTVSTVPFTTVADGYMWKYMFTLSSAADQKFSNDTYFPIVSNTTIVSNAVAGAIHVVLIEDAGTDYYLHAGTVQEVVSNTVFKIETTGSAANGFYIDSTATITSGTGEGNQALISGYHVNASGKFVTTTTNLGIDLTSEYSIGPSISIVGNGTGSEVYVSAVNDTTGAIEGVTVIGTGTGYDYVESISVEAFSGSGANLLAIISPQGGHGSQPQQELLCEHLGISVAMANNESGTIPDDVSFRTATLVLNPTVYGTSTAYSADTFNALQEINLASSTGTFSIGERVRGLTSNASGIVASANATYVRLSALQGTMANSEIVQGANGLVTATTDGINNPDINPTSAAVMFISNVLEVERANNKVETVKIYARF